MSNLRLTLSIWDYDRTRALADGSVQPEGIDLKVLELLRYHHEQGLSKRRFQPEELFAPETMEAFEI